MLSREYEVTSLNMRRASLIISLSAVLLMTACSPAPNSNDVESDTQALSQTSQTEQALTPSEANGDSNVSPSKLKQAQLARRQADSAFGQIAESDTGTYIYYEDRLWYSDHERTFFMPLCGRPECEHIDEQCNAWIEARRFGVDNEHIYYVTFPQFDFGKEISILIEIRAARLDGSEHRLMHEVVRNPKRILHETSATPHYGLDAIYFTDYPFLDTSVGTGLYRAPYHDLQQVEQLLSVDDAQGVWLIMEISDRLILSTLVPGIGDRLRILN